MRYTALVVSALALLNVAHALPVLDGKAAIDLTKDISQGATGGLRRFDVFEGLANAAGATVRGAGNADGVIGLLSAADAALGLGGVSGVTDAAKVTGGLDGVSDVADVAKVADVTKVAGGLDNAGQLTDAANVGNTLGKVTDAAKVGDIKNVANLKSSSEAL